ncbi:MAG: DegV family protein [Faecousia sp.]
MSNYRIITDSCCDLPKEFVQQQNLAVVPLYLQWNGRSYQDGEGFDMKDLYASLRAGQVITTAAVNPGQWTQYMEPVLNEGQDVLVLAFSSGLSTTYQSACIAASDLGIRYPQRKIRVIDTRCASLGQGLYVWYALKKQEEGLELDALVTYLEELKPRLCHWFTVDDLMYLKRGGRVSAATALVGTMLQIKPVLHTDDEGHLINMGKARGRKASIEALCKKMEELGLPGENSTVFICHGDCIEDANYLANLVRDRCGVKEVLIGYTGSVIGAHSGPGTLALFFLGKHR